MERSGWIRGRQHDERNVLVKSSTKPQVNPGKIEARCRQSARMRTVRGDAGCIIHRLIVRALAMPIWSDSHRHWKIGWIARDRRIAVVHHLIAVVAEHLPEVIEFRPTDMTSRTRQSVLSRERRNCIGWLRSREQHSQH